MDTGLLMSGGGVKSAHFKVVKDCCWKFLEGSPKVVDINLDVWLEKRDTTSIYVSIIHESEYKWFPNKEMCCM